MKKIVVFFINFNLILPTAYNQFFITNKAKSSVHYKLYHQYPKFTVVGNIKVDEKKSFPIFEGGLGQYFNKTERYLSICLMSEDLKDAAIINLLDYKIDKLINSNFLIANDFSLTYIPPS